MKNRKSVTICLALGMFLAVSGVAHANMVTFEFDPDDFIGLYSTTPLPVSNPTGTSHLKYEQDSPRRVHETWGGVMHNTFGSTNVGETDQQSQNAYLAWRNSLDTSHEGIYEFNIWLRDNTNAWNWGERLVSNPDVMPTATAASGWQTSVIANPWGSGWLAQWWTDEANNLINLANDLDEFSFTVDVRQISASGQTYAQGTDITLGTDWDIWFGGYVKSDQYDWTGYEGTLEIQAVPVPAAVLLGMLGLSVAGVKLRKKNA